MATFMGLLVFYWIFLYFIHFYRVLPGFIAEHVNHCGLTPNFTQFYGNRLFFLFLSVFLMPYIFHWFNEVLKRFC